MRAIGAFTRELRAEAGGSDPVARLRESGLDERAAANLVAYLDEQALATGAVPDDRTIVVERFRDEIGDWRVCVLSPFGAQVHAPWAMALQHRLGERWGLAVELMWSDDGIVIRLPESVDSELFVLIDEGDNQPLPIDKATILLPSFAVRLNRPANEPLRMLYGKDGVASPRYDLQLLTPQVMGRVATEVTAGAEQRFTAVAPRTVRPSGLRPGRRARSPLGPGGRGRAARWPRPRTSSRAP